MTGNHVMNPPSKALRLATLGIFGRSPVAPGTIATLFVGIPSGYLLALSPIQLAFPLLLLVLGLGIHVSGRAEKETGRHDPQEVVIDELVGYLIAVIFFEPSVKNLLLGFVAFRVFDIWKPWPVNVLQERLKGGVGIVMDDVAAGVYAMLLVWGSLRVWP